MRILPIGTPKPVDPVMQILPIGIPGQQYREDPVMRILPIGTPGKPYREEQHERRNRFIESNKTNHNDRARRMLGR